MSEPLTTLRIMGTELSARAGMRTFIGVLVNTAVANVTTSFLWFALTFWAYLETESVLATGIIGGAYMLLLAVFAIPFGALVDRHRKHRVMAVSTAVTFVAFTVAGSMFLVFPADTMSDMGAPWFWIFSGVVLFGAVIENLRNIAMSTTVTLLVPTEKHANANGLVGTVQGIAFAVTSVFSGLAIAVVGMGGTVLIAIIFTLLSLAHLAILRIPEAKPQQADGSAHRVDLRASVATIRSIPGLFPLLFFATFNNLIGGVYMALMDPYGLILFPVEWWGAVLAFSATGFMIGGAVIAMKGLGRNPIRTMLVGVVIMGALGALFTVREWAWLYVLGMWLYMMLIPAIEAAEQTVIQKVVPFERQGRVFGFAQAIESAAAPVTSFLIAPIAQFWVIPFMDSADGQRALGWLLGEGEARGIALIFIIAGLVMVIAALAAFSTRSYRQLSESYAGQTESVRPNASPEAAPGAAPATGALPTVG